MVAIWFRPPIIGINSLHCCNFQISIFKPIQKEVAILAKLCIYLVCIQERNHLSIQCGDEGPRNRWFPPWHQQSAQHTAAQARMPCHHHYDPKELHWLLLVYYLTFLGDAQDVWVTKTISSCGWQVDTKYAVAYCTSNFLKKFITLSSNYTTNELQLGINKNVPVTKHYTQI